MKSGFFTWPSRKYKCVDCGKEFENISGNCKRCGECKEDKE